MQSKYVVKIGHQGDLILLIQRELGLIQDGKFDYKTQKAVENFQRTNGLVADGIVGPMTWRKLGYNPLELEADTEAITSATWIEQYNLPDNEYVKKETAKSSIILHHTSGLHNPYKVIDTWAKDQRGRIGAHFVIGGLSTKVDIENISEDQRQYDGKILQAIPDQYWAYNLGNISKANDFHHKNISIELCSAGKLEYKNGEYYTWYGAKVHPTQVARLDIPFKGHRYFHKYSQAQIDSLKALILLLGEKHDINIHSGLLEQIELNVNLDKKPFEYKPVHVQNAHQYGLMTHGQLHPDKLDLFPDPTLINGLRSI